VNENFCGMLFEDKWVNVARMHARTHTRACIYPIWGPGEIFVASMLVYSIAETSHFL
jgi:hypothetical protein